MWDKTFRQNLIIVIYYLEFNGYDLSDFNVIDWNLFKDYKDFGLSLDDLSILNVKETITHYYKFKSEFGVKVDSSLSSITKTSLLTKSVLSVFLIEKELNPDFQANIKPIINNYLKISQDYLGKDSGSVLHAVMNKYGQVTTDNINSQVADQ